MGAPKGNKNAAGKHGVSKMGRHIAKLGRERRAGMIRGKKSRKRANKGKSHWRPS